MRPIARRRQTRPASALTPARASGAGWRPRPEAAPRRLAKGPWTGGATAVGGRRTGPWEAVRWRSAAGGTDETAAAWRKGDGRVRRGVDGLSEGRVRERGGLMGWGGGRMIY
eukprot:289663-Chlamydomonas_euryale.AAC.1